MAKGTAVPKPTSLTQKDIYARMNYHLNAAFLLQKKIPPRDSLEDRVSKSLASSVKSLSQKALIRRDPSVKHGICPACFCILVPGFTCSIRIKPSKVHARIVKRKCSSCGHVSRLPAPKSGRTYSPGAVDGMPAVDGTAPAGAPADTDRPDQPQSNVDLAQVRRFLETEESIKSPNPPHESEKKQKSHKKKRQRTKAFHKIPYVHRGDNFYLFSGQELLKRPSIEP